MIKDWLERNNLEHLVDIFESESIGLDVLPALTESNLNDLGIVLGDRIRLERAIRNYRSPSDSVDRGVQRRQVTILFCDLVGSTRLSRFLDVEDYLVLLEDYQKVVSQIMTSFGGLVIRYHGDGVLVVFGYPNSHEDDPDRAILAGNSAVLAVGKMRSSAGDILAARVGIATGEVIVGKQLGEDITAQLSVAGSTTNLAARIQGLAKPGGVVVSEATYRLSRLRTEIEIIDSVELRGIEELTTVYNILSIEKSSSNSIFSESASKDRFTPLVSRNEELEIMKRAWNRVLDGEGQFIYVTGDAGIGKSRLVQQFLSVANDSPVYFFYCRQLTTNTALYPLIDTIKSKLLSHQLDDTQKKLAQLLGLNRKSDAQTLLVFHKLISEENHGISGNSIALDKKTILRALFQVLERQSTKQPFVIIVEDLHWADPTSLEFLTATVDWLTSFKVLIIVTGRPENTHAFTTNPGIQTLNLSKLSRSESQDVINHIDGESRLSKVHYRAIISRCDGIPLYLEEITRAVLEGSSIDRISDQSISIPDTLKDLLMARLDRLGYATKLAQIAAVIGRQFTESQLVKVSGLGPAVVKEGVAKLLESNIAVSRVIDDLSVYEFNHALIRDAAYRSMLRDEKVRLHAAIASEIFPIGSIADHECENAAWHYESAGDIVNSVNLWEAAGTRAHQQSANIEAERLFQRALDLTEHLAQTPVALLNETKIRLTLLLGAELIACYGNGADVVVENYRKAQKLCSKTSSVKSKFHALHGLQSCEMVRGDLVSAKKIGLEMLELAEDVDDSNLNIQAHRSYGWCRAAMGYFNEARVHLNEAIILYDPNLHCPEKSGLVSDPLVLAKCNLALVECFPGQGNCHHAFLMNQ